MIRIVDNHDFESLLGALINLLCLRHLFQQILHDDSVIIPDV
jgi:hypothetical protein